MHVGAFLSNCAVCRSCFFSSEDIPGVMARSTPHCGERGDNSDGTPVLGVWWPPFRLPFPSRFRCMPALRAFLTTLARRRVVHTTGRGCDRPPALKTVPGREQPRRALARMLVAPRPATLRLCGLAPLRFASARSNLVSGWDRWPRATRWYRGCCARGD